jgi:DNA polymerase III subunit gamma/tau
MSYLVSARKYRPGTFDQLIGQEHIAHTLKNAISRDRVAHAYLFSGPRGIGKTSAARIFAKSLNCEQGPTPQPCGVCSFCTEIAEGRSLDLVEIDGASNRRIDEVRQLRENVRFVPTSSRYKVYIIDEVHMLTTEAFNALLKTLEEPPGHVIFIFATTEIHKVPPTIRSRCQQFVFKRIPIPLIVEGLKNILEDVEVSCEDRALFWIAKSALGSMRDAQSILDQMISYSEGTISEKDVFFVLGIPGYEVYHELAEHISRGDTTACFTLFDRLLKEGVEIVPLVSGMIEYYRNLFVLTLDGGQETDPSPGTGSVSGSGRDAGTGSQQHTGIGSRQHTGSGSGAASGSGAEELIDLPAEDIQRMRQLLESYTAVDIQNVLTLLTRLSLDLRSTDIARELFEVTLIKLARYRDIVDPARLVKRLENLRRSMPETGSARRNEAETHNRGGGSGPGPDDSASYTEAVPGPVDGTGKKKTMT